VFVPIHALVRRWRGGAPRAAEVAAVRARVAGAAAHERPSAEERAIASRLRELRAEVAAEFDGVGACRGCASGKPAPHGRFAGGFCCGGKTEGVFDEDEVAALAAGGTRPRHLRPPAGEHAGCAFRGPESCSLDARDRPTLCVRFVCRELEAELRERGEWARVRGATRRLEEEFARFVRARRERRAALEATSRDPFSGP
jgi:hypothetical protein